MSGKLKFSLTCLLLICSIFVLMLPMGAMAEDTVNLYYHDGRMATVPLWMADSCRADGWQDEFPYFGKEIWLHSSYLKYQTTDIYGTASSQLIDPAQTYTKVRILWYDDNDFSQISQYQKSLHTLIFDYNGGQYKMPFGDFLRCRSEWNDYQQIYWEDPKAAFGIADKSWNDLQAGYIWTGMPQNEFLLLAANLPDDINSYNYGFGTTEQWVYRYDNFDNDYYYFRNGVLTSWQQ